jgi:hypothetical protein
LHHREAGGDLDLVCFAVELDVRNLCHQCFT